jgi:hypothetical protein
MFVMDFVSATNSTSIGVINISEPFKALMYEDVMYNEVGDTVC